MNRNVTKVGGNTYLNAPLIPAAGNSKRAIFNALKRAYKLRNMNPVITESYLRLESVLGTQNAINFNVLAQNTSVAPRATEQRLQLTDTFSITSMAFLIGKQASGAPDSSLVLDTYVNPQIFSGAGEAAALQAIYNGKLSIDVNRTSYLAAWDIARHQNVNTAQQLLAQTVTAGILAGASSVYSRNAYEDDSIFKDLTPGINISGNQTIAIQAQLPGSVNMTGASGTNVACLYLRGFLIQNVTQ